MRCRAMQALHLLALEPIAETTADPNSYGFRPERATADAGAQCFIVLAKKANAQWVLEADIKACYDEISHAWMVANIPTDKAILQKWLKAGYVYQDELFPTEAGVPQGGIISPVAANMTLDGLEAMLAKKFPKAEQTRLKMHMVRYADDFIITGNSKEWLENEVKSTGRIPGRTRTCSVAGKDQGNAYRRRVRLPRMEFPQVQRQAVDQAVESECQSPS